MFSAAVIVVGLHPVTPQWCVKAVDGKARSGTWCFQKKNEANVCLVSVPATRKRFKRWSYDRKMVLLAAWFKEVGWWARGEGVPIWGKRSWAVGFLNVWSEWNQELRWWWWWRWKKWDIVVLRKPRKHRWELFWKREMEHGVCNTYTAD